jgi:ACT domain-containing protein
MNWRIDLDYFLVKELVFKGKLRDLLAEDQLLKNIKYDNVLEKFSEGQITFNPTYKYDDNSDIYDTSKKQRVPSWTDRILY